MIPVVRRTDLIMQPYSSTVVIRGSVRAALCVVGGCQRVIDSRKLQLPDIFDRFPAMAPLQPGFISADALDECAPRINPSPRGIATNSPETARHEYG